MTDTSSPLTPEQIAELKRRREERQGKVIDFNTQRNMVLETDTPDDAAYDLQKAEELGVPREAIGGAREEYKAEDTLRKMQQMRQAAPRASEWLAAPENYAVAKDDIESLSQLEVSLKKVPPTKQQYDLSIYNELPAVTFAKNAFRDPKKTALDAAKQTGDAGRSFLSAAPMTVGSVSSGLGAWLDSAIEFNEKQIIGSIPGATRAVNQAKDWESKFWARHPEVAKAITPYAGPSAILKTYGAEGKKVQAAWQPADMGFEDKVAQGLGQVVVQVGLALATGGTSVGAGISTGSFMAMGADQQAESLKAAGLNPDEYFGQLSAGAAITGSAEMMRLNSILKIMPPAMRDRVTKSVVSRIASQAFEEGAQEAIEGVLHNVVTMTYDPRATILGGVAEAGAVGGTVGGLFQGLVELLTPGKARGGSTLTLDKMMEELARQETEMAESPDEKALADTIARVGKMKLTGLSPAKAAEAIGKITEGTGVETVTVDLDGVVEALNQSGIDPVEALASLGVTEQEIGQRFERFGQIEVSTATLLTSPLMRDNAALVSPHLRTGSDTATPAQKEVLRETMKEEVKTYVETIQGLMEQGKTTAEKITQVREAFKARILGAGMDTQGPQLEAKLDALTALLTTLPQRTGQDVLDFYAARAPKIQGVMEGEVMAEADVLPQAQSAGYQGSDRGEAKQWLRGVEKFGPEGMTTEARMARAEAAGFKGGYFHGARVYDALLKDGTQLGNIEAFDRETSAKFRKRSMDTLGVWLSDNPGERGAGMYAGDVVEGNSDGRPIIYPLMVRADNTFETTWDEVKKKAAELNDDPEGKMPSSMEPYREWLKDKGYDSVSFASDNPEFAGQKVTVILDENNIRSVNATFDPDQSDSADLLGQELSSGEMQTLDAETQEAITDPETDVLPLTDDMQVMELDEFLAFHGTLAKFDKFETDKIGAGEGAQAFGPGHYFTQSRGIADWYRKRMKTLSPGIRMGKEAFNKANPAHFALAEYWKYRDKLLHYDLFGGYKSLASDRTHRGALEGAIFSLQYEIDQLEAPFLYPGGRGASDYAAADRPIIRDSKELVAFLKQGLAYLKTLDPESSKGIPKPRKPVLRGGGNIYTVSVKLPAEQIIQYDKPFGQQPAAVQKAFREAAEAGHLGKAGAALEKYGDATRMDVLVAALKNMKSPAMDAMRANGIRGVRYLDGMSRGKKNKAGQSYNYVVFNDGDVKILDREGKLFQMMDQQRRGQYAPRTDLITLFEQADITTLMHEAAHWYLETLYSMSVEPDAHPFVVEQYEAIRKWGKVGPDFRMYDDMGRLTPEAVELHESFAETFEVYLQTGKAPSAALRSAFQAFKKWITQLWKRMYGGGQPERANLNPEIVAVMDRMLAVDEEIDAQVEGIIRSAEQQADELLKRGIITKRQRDTAIMNLEAAREGAKEDLMAVLMDRYMREKTEEWEIERRRTRRDVLREFDVSPRGRAHSWLGYGQWKGDVPSSEAPGDSEAEFFQRGEQISEAQAVASREFDDEADRIFEESEFRWDMLDDEMERIMAPIDAKLEDTGNVDLVQIGEDAKEKFLNEGIEALNPDDENYDADLAFLEEEADRVYQEAYDKAEAELEVEMERLQEERDQLADSESLRLEEEAIKQIEEYRTRAITELVDRFEEKYGAAALLNTKYEEYSGYDSRDRYVMNSEGQLLPIENFFEDGEETLPQRAYHGTQREIIGVLQPSPDGLLGPGINLAKQPDKAKAYAGENGQVYIVDFDETRLATYAQWKAARTQAGREMGAGRTRAANQLAVDRLTAEGFIGVDAGDTVTIWSSENIAQRKETLGQTLPRDLIRGAAGRDIGTAPALPSKAEMIVALDVQVGFAEALLADNQSTDLADVTLRLRRTMEQADTLPRNEFLGAWYANMEALARVTDGIIPPFAASVRDALASPLGQRVKAVLDDRGVRILQAEQVGEPPVLLIRARVFEGDTLGQEVVRPAEKADTTVAGGLTEKSFIRTRDLEGATIFPMFADLTDAGSTFAALDGLPIAPTPYLGGPNFPWLKSYRDAGIVWAFNAPGVISKVRNKVRALKEQARAEGRSDRVVITMLAMKDDAHTSNEMVVSALLRTLDAVVAAGRFPQEQLAQAKELIVSKAGKKDEGYSELATFPGFGDAQALHDWIRTATFTGRKALASEMRSAAFQQMPGMFPVERIVREAIDPDYRATQQGDALLAFEIDPDAEDLIIDFENKDQAGNVPRHPAYRYGMRGTLVGSFSTHIPMEVLYADLLPAVVGRAAPGSNPKFLMERLKTSDAQVVTEDIVREAEVIEGLHDYRIAQAHTAGIAGQWRSSDVAANRGGVNPVEFERALLENQAAATLTKYTRTDVTKGKKDGSLRVFQLGGARVQDGGLNVWMAVKAGYDYRNEYPGEVTDALVEQGILTDNEVALVGVASNELGVSGMATFQVLKGIEEGVTVLDAFKVTSPSKPDGLLPTIYATLGFEEVGQIPFDPQYYDAQQLADLKAIWTRQGWNEADGYPAVAIMKWRGDDAIRPEATRRFILESQAGLGIGSGTDVDGLRTARRRVSDGPRQSDQGDGLPGQGDGRADPRRFADRARSVSGTVRSYVENILAADARAIKALKLPQELIDRIRAEYGPVLEQTPDDTLGQPVAPTFYSALGRFVSRSGTARAPAAQWKGMIQNAPGIKPEEVEWTGVMEWLDLQQGAVTREALAQFVEANGVRVEEVVRGQSASDEEMQRQLLPLIEERDRLRRERDQKIDANLRIYADNPDFRMPLDPAPEITARLRELSEQISDLETRQMRGSEVKWSSFTLPGGENYREMLLTLPVEQKTMEQWRVRRGDGQSAGLFDSEASAQAWIEANGTTPGFLRIEREKDVVLNTGFRSSHWSELNVLAHVRFKERTGPNGERVLALEEIQSDWHQAGRERGYKEKGEPATFEDWYAGNGMALFGIPFDQLDARAQGMARQRWEDATRRGFTGAVPNAPFKNNAWTELVLKRMIRFAAENGFDAVAWIPGNIQNGQVVETDDNRGDFYDKIVPNAANKLGKKYGARVTDMVMEGAAPPAKSEYFVEGNEEDGYTVQDANNRRTVADGFRYEEDAFAWIGENEPSPDVTFHSLPITPELAAAAMTEGFPLFQPGDPKGWGETAPPPGLPPMRLDLARAEELYGKAAVDALPKAIKDRYRDQTSVDTMLAAARGAAKTLKRKPPKSLFQFIRARKSRAVEGKSVPQKQWGIKGATDELKAMDRADLINEASGIDIDYMRELAEGAGYLPENSTVNDLLNAIDREARGEPVYSEQDANEVLEIQSAQQWADWLSENGVDIFETDQRKLKAAIAKVTRTTNADLKSPDEAAELLGFETGEQLLKALAEAGSREKYIDAETDRRMREEFGDPFASGEFAEAARQAAEAEVKFRAAEIEIEALARALGETAASKLAKEMAMDALSVMTVKELAGWERFLEIERREMRNAMKAVQAGDISKALTHKRRQLVNGHLAKAAREKSEAIEKTRKDLLTYFTSKGRRDKIDRGYLEKIEALLETYELRKSKQTPGVQRKALSAKEYVDQMVADGREAEIAPEAMLLAAQADKKVWRGLTVDEVEYLAGTVKNLAHLGRTKNSLMKAQDKRRFDAVVAELVDALVIDENGKQVPRRPLKGAQREYSFRKTAGEKITSGLRTSHAWLMRMEHQFRALDGKANGPIWNALFRIFADAADVESKMMAETAREVREAYEIYTPLERYKMHNVSISLPELPSKVGKRWTKMEVISMAMNWGVEYNRQALLDGYGWEAAQVEAVFARLMTDKDWDFVERVWQVSGKYKTEAFALEKQMTGVEPKSVEGIEFTTASGRKIKGRYFHLEYDGRQLGQRSRRQAQQDAKEALSDRMKSFTKPMTKNGGLINRVGSGGKPVKLHISVFDKAVADTIHDIAYRRAVIDASRIINDPRFADAYEVAAGKEAYEQLMPWIEAIVKPPSDQATGGLAALVAVRRNLPVAYMGYKVGTALIQATGLLAGVPEVGLRWVAQGFAKATVGSPLSLISAYQAVAEKSEMMRDRPMGYDRDVREITTAMGASTPLGAIKRNAFILISGMDLFVSVPVWIGAYDKAMAGKVKGVDAGNDEDAIAYADGVIRRTQTSGRPQDLARVSRDSELWKQVSMLYGYFSNLYGYTSQQVRAVRTGETTPPQFLFYMTIMFVAIPILTELLAGRLLPGDDEDDDETIEEKMGKAVVSNFAGMFPVVRDVVNYQLEPQYGYKLSPVASGMQDVAMTVNAPLDGEMTEGEYRRAVRAMGAIFGLPSSQLVITGDYLADLLSGTEAPLEDPADAAREALVRDTR